MRRREPHENKIGKCGGQSLSLLTLPPPHIFPPHILPKKDGQAFLRPKATNTVLEGGGGTKTRGQIDYKPRIYVKYLLSH